MITPTFDDGKIADLAKQIKGALVEIERLHELSEHAKSELGRAQTTLRNLQCEFTKAVDGSLDMHSLKQRVPESYLVGRHEMKAKV